MALSIPALERSSTRLLKNGALLPIRGALGATMVFHGLAKVKPEGREQAGQMFEKLELRPGKPLAVATGAAEIFAGVGALLGLWTRPAALAVLVTQGVAIARVHAKNGFDITKGGYEYNVALMAIAGALLLAGPGLFSAHEGLEHLAYGRGGKRWLRRARPSPLVKFLKLIK